MNNDYIIKKNVDKIRNGGYTYFLNPGMFKEVRCRLKKNDYLVYKPYPDSDKVILYTDFIPVVRLLEIESFFPLNHREILGSLFGLSITEEMFGDIIVDEDKYYFFLMDEIADFVLNNLVMIGNKRVKLKEVDLNILNDYHKKLERIEIVVSSLRIDTVISRLVGISRDGVKRKIRDKDVIVNYVAISSNCYNFKENDVFSIKGIGKYKFGEIVGKTKKDNYIICCFKYL